MDDLTVEYVSITDEHQLQRDQTTRAFKRVVFYLGRFGPFTERIDAAADFDGELALRVTKLRASLHNLPR